jgi:DNA-binding HxlR family transcriptional regulator
VASPAEQHNYQKGSYRGHLRRDTLDMSRYRQEYCPIVRASEVIAERWTPIIVRNLLLGCETFSQIAAGVPGISASLLSERLRTLERFGIIVRHRNPKGRGWLYRLTPAGRELQGVCDALGTWGQRWLDAAPQDLDPGIVLWAVAKTMDSDRLPSRRVVVRFDLQDVPKDKFWIVVQHPRAELCRKHPGFEEDLIVRTDSRRLSMWHMGRISTADALRDGVLDIEGPPALVRAFTRWGGQSPFAGVRPETSARSM